MDEVEPSRTFKLSDEVVSGLCSPIYEVRSEAIYELPDALTPEEIKDVGIQVNLAAGNRLSKGRELERDALFHLGTTALYLKGDIITAENSARELLRDYSVLGVIGYVMIKHAIRGVRKDLIQEIINSTSD